MRPVSHLSRIDRIAIASDLPFDPTTLVGAREQSLIGGSCDE